MSQPNVTERLGIAGSGVIACGLARAAVGRTDVVLWARSDDSAHRARTTITMQLEGVAELAALAEEIDVVTELDRLTDCTVVVESVVEELDTKSKLLRRLDGILPPDVLLASTTSALSVAALAEASGRPERFGALHFFNPVDKMELVELCYAEQASEDTRARFAALCEALGKTPVVVPDSPGFVVNRLLFPYLFDAVRLLDQDALSPEAVDTCMKLGAAHPMGPLKLLDFVGLDVAMAIAESIGIEVPERVRSLITQGKLGRKSGAGFYTY